MKTFRYPRQTHDLVLSDLIADSVHQHKAVSAIDENDPEFITLRVRSNDPNLSRLEKAHVPEPVIEEPAAPETDAKD